MVTQLVLNPEFIILSPPPLHPISPSLLSLSSPSHLSQPNYSVFDVTVFDVIWFLPLCS